MGTTTAAAIRDRAITVISALVPISLRERFVAFRNEEGAEFLKWAEANPDAAFRRFQVRDDGNDQPPNVSNSDVEERLVTLAIRIAYPQNSRAGVKNALDRDRVMSEDQFKIEKAVGYSGASNFTSPNPDASWRDGRVRRVVGNSCDFLEIVQTMGYYRAIP